MHIGSYTENHGKDRNMPMSYTKEDEIAILVHALSDAALCVLVSSALFAESSNHLPNLAPDQKVLDEVTDFLAVVFPH